MVVHIWVCAMTNNDAEANMSVTKIYMKSACWQR